MNQKTIIVVVLCTLFVLGAVVGGLEFSGRTHFFTAKPKKETVQEAMANVAKKQALASGSSNPTTSSGNDTVVKSTPAMSPTDTKDYSAPTSDNGIIITANQANSNEETISTRLTGYSDGTCNLTVSNNGKITSQSAPVMFEREFSTCAGFNVPISPIGAGAWKIKLEVLSGGNSASKSITAEVK